MAHRKWNEEDEGSKNAYSGKHTHTRTHKRMQDTGWYAWLCVVVCRGASGGVCVGVCGYVVGCGGEVVCGSVLEVYVVLCVVVCVSVCQCVEVPPTHLSVPTPPPLRRCRSTCLLSRSKSPGGKSTRPHTGSRCRRGTRVGTRTRGSTRTVQAWLRCCGTAGSSTHPHSRGSRLHRRQRTCPGHRGTGLAQRSLTVEGGRRQNTPPGQVEATQYH